MTICHGITDNIKCNKNACYNFPNIKKGKFCNIHKEPDMIDVKNKRCEHTGCMKQPIFNLKGCNIGKFCSIHKEAGMIDVKNKRCIILNCHTLVQYGYLFQEKTHCSRHKLPNQYTKNRPKCVINNCTEKPLYVDKETKSTYPVRCELHSLKTDINILERRCSACNILNFIRVGDTLCDDCHQDSTTDVCHIKENHIKDILDSNNIIYESYDKIINIECSKKRPDFVIPSKSGLYKIILEVDENQHTSYACECEQTRMIQLHQDFEGFSIVFIRFNPDSYIDNLNIKHSDYTGRDKKLLDVIKSFDNVHIINYCEIIYMYYDGFDGTIIRKEFIY